MWQFWIGDEQNLKFLWAQYHGKFYKLHIQIWLKLNSPTIVNISIGSYIPSLKLMTGSLREDITWALIEQSKTNRFADKNVSHHKCHELTCNSCLDHVDHAEIALWLNFWCLVYILIYCVYHLIVFWIYDCTNISHTCICIYHLILSCSYNIIVIRRNKHMNTTEYMRSTKNNSYINPMGQYQKFNGIDIATYILYIFTGFMSNNTLMIIGVISPSDLGYASIR